MEKTGFLEKYAKLLFFAAVLLTEIYLQVGAYCYVMPAFDRALGLVKRFAVILGAAAGVYVLILFFRFPEKRSEWKQRLQKALSYEQAYLVFVFFWYFVSVAHRQCLVGGTHFADNKLWMFETGIAAFLLFPLAQYAGTRNAKKTMEFLLKTVVIPLSIFLGWQTWHYFHMNYVMFPSGQQMLMTPPMILCYSYINHNALARLAMTAVSCSLYLVITQKPPEKVLYAICFAVSLVYLILTNPRTSWYVTAAMLVSAAFFFCWNRMDGRKQLIRAGAGILLAAAIGLGCHLLRGEVFILLDRSVTSIREAKAAAEAEAVEEAMHAGYGLRTMEARIPEEAKRPGPASEAAALAFFDEDSAAANARRYDDNLSTVGNRLPLYQASIKLMFSDPHCFFFGVTPTDAIEELRAYDGVSPTFDYVTVHNFFLQMGVSYGVPTMIATMVFACSLLIRSIRILFINRKKAFPGAWMICLTVLFFLANDTLEAALNISHVLFCSVFYLLGGWLVTVDRAASQTEKQTVPSMQQTAPTER